jgi:hypothetical protein
MKFIVLNIPSFWKHPIKPVVDSVLKSLSESESVISSLLFAVASMHDMMAYHSPSNADSSRQKYTANDDRERGKYESENLAHISPPNHFLKMFKVLIEVLRLFQLFLNLTTFRSPSFEIELSSPFTSWLKVSIVVNWDTFWSIYFSCLRHVKIFLIL